MADSHPASRHFSRHHSTIHHSKFPKALNTLPKIDYNPGDKIIKKMQYIGVDIIEIARIEKAAAHWGKRFLHRIYTDAELRLYRKKPASLAARFASKEAVMKLLGNERKGVGWREIEVLSHPSGKPLLNLYGRAQIKAERLGLKSIAISLSHSKEYAIAMAAGETK